jgi:hypothetical protein
MGAFQDGGLTDNFAGGIARRISRSIWKWSHEPARLLSLGTGKIPRAASPSTPHFHHVFRDGFLRRIFSAWMTSLDSEGRWREMKSQLDPSLASNFRRFDVTLEETSPALDDVGMMDPYRNLVTRSPESARLAREAAADLLTARFHMVLQEPPAHRRFPLRCHGIMRCKAPIRPLLSTLEALMGTSLTLAIDHQGLGPPLSERDICPACGRFYRPVSFLARSLDQTINIYLKAGRKFQWRINGFPATVSTLVRRAGLDLPFGLANHGQPWVQPCPVCDSGEKSLRGRHRKRASGMREESQRKRVCVVASHEDNSL